MENATSLLSISISEELVRNVHTGKVIGLRRKMLSGDRLLCEVFIVRDSRLVNVDLCSLMNNLTDSILRPSNLISQSQKATDVPNRRYYLFSLFGKKWFSFFKFIK